MAKTTNLFDDKYVASKFPENINAAWMWSLKSFAAFANFVIPKILIRVLTSLCIKMLLYIALQACQQFVGNKFIHWTTNMFLFKL